MKLREMAVAVGRHPEYSTPEVNAAVDWLKNASEVTQLEGNKFTLLRKGNSFALKRNRDQQILGWVLIDPLTKLFGRMFYPLVNIQVLPEYRNSIVAFLLIHGIREVLDYPVIVDNPVFLGGQRLLDAMAKRESLPNVLLLDKKTGDVMPYTSGSLSAEDKYAVVLEHTLAGLNWASEIPGGTKVQVNIVLFESMTSDFE